MPDLTEALRQKELQEKSAAQKDLACARAESQRLIARQFGRYDRLLQNEDFQWWLKEVARPALQAEHDSALDLKSKTERERSDHAQRYVALKSLLDGLPRERARLRAQSEQAAALLK